ncbi:MAG: hypothetical protein U5K84_13270 [Alkalibacterium sp.]|nr:hypothetical protein [Alkalibacterium sp.]
MPLCEQAEWEENKPQALILVPDSGVGATGQGRPYEYRPVKADQGDGGIWEVIL